MAAICGLTDERQMRSISAAAREHMRGGKRHLITDLDGKHSYICGFQNLSSFPPMVCLLCFCPTQRQAEMMSTCLRLTGWRSFAL